MGPPGVGRAVVLDDWNRLWVLRGGGSPPSGSLPFKAAGNGRSGTIDDWMCRRQVLPVSHFGRGQTVYPPVSTQTEDALYFFLSSGPRRSRLLSQKHSPPKIRFRSSIGRYLDVTIGYGDVPIGHFCFDVEHKQMQPIPTLHRRHHDLRLGL